MLLWVELSQAQPMVEVLLGLLGELLVSLLGLLLSPASNPIGNMEQKHPIGTSSVGNKGYPKTTGAPTVSPIALGAMKSNQRNYDFNFSKLTSITKVDRSLFRGDWVAFMSQPY